jgi:nucleotide exchange factor SIL1
LIPVKASPLSQKTLFVRLKIHKIVIPEVFKLLEVKEGGSLIWLEFQPIREGQEIPKGLHVRVDIQTGEKEAKLVDAEGERDVLPLASNATVENTTPAEPLSENKTHFHGGANAPKTHKSKIGLREKDAFAIYLQTFDDHVKESNVSQILETLDELEEMVHHIDWGYEFVQTGNGFSILFPLLNHSDADVRSRTALVIGSTMQVNQ